MAQHSQGDILTYQASTGAEPAIVLDAISSRQATILVIPRSGIDDAYVVGPSPGFTTDATPVSINDTSTLGTAATSGSGRIAQDLRDTVRFLPAASLVGGSWSRTGTHSLEFQTTQPGQTGVLELADRTQFTRLDFEVQHDIGSTVTVELFVNKGAGPTQKATWTSDPNIGTWQPRSLSFGTTYPAPLEAAVWYVDIVSGPNLPGLQTFKVRNIKLLAEAITA